MHSPVSEKTEKYSEVYLCTVIRAGQKAFHFSGSDSTGIGSRTGISYSQFGDRTEFFLKFGFLNAKFLKGTQRSTVLVEGRYFFTEAVDQTLLGWCRQVPFCGQFPRSVRRRWDLWHYSE